MDRDWLPELSPEDARIYNGLIGQQRHLTAQLDGQTYAIELSSMTSFPPNELVAEMSIGGRTWQLALQRVEQLPAVQALLGDAKWDDLPEDLQWAVFNAVFGSWMDAFAALAGWEVSLKSWQRKTAISSDDLTLGVTLTGKDNGCWRGWVSLPRDMAPTVVDVLRRFPLRSPETLPDFPVPVRCEYGSTQLSVAEFRSLRSFDVLLIERFSGGDRQHLVLRAGSKCWTAKIDEQHLLVEQEMNTTKADTGNAASLGESLVDSLPVRITFDLGEELMSVQELASLKPGFIWKLASPLDRLVTVRANGQPICQGELVAIGERMGVRLVEVLHERQSA